MTKVRSSHDPKTARERQRYYSTAIKRTPTPTIEEPLFDEVDSTETLSPDIETTRTTPTYARVGRESRVLGFLKDNFVDLVLAAVLAVVGMIAISLNREVGELKAQLNEVKSQQAQQQQLLQQQLDKAESRLQAAIDRINDRVDREK
jgi:hypothetical protein